MPELRSQFHAQLGLIDRKVVQLFALVAEGLAAATDALLAGDRDTHRVIVAREEIVDELYRDVELLVAEQFARQAPVAGELRYLLSALRIVPELERSHDLVEHIARRAEHGLGSDLTPRARGLIAGMGAVGTEMWRETSESWTARDGTRAAEVYARDEEMDELHAAVTAEVGRGHTSVPVAMETALVARFYERLGDHAVNIARRVVYVVGDLPAFVRPVVESPPG